MTGQLLLSYHPQQERELLYLLLTRPLHLGGIRKISCVPDTNTLSSLHSVALESLSWFRG